MNNVIKTMFLTFVLCACSTSNEDLKEDRMQLLTDNKIDFSRSYNWEEIINISTENGADFSPYSPPDEFGNQLPYSFVFDLDYRPPEGGIRNGKPEANCYATQSELISMFPNIKLYKTNSNITSNNPENELNGHFLTWIKGLKSDIYIGELTIYTGQGEFVPNRYIPSSIRQINCGFNNTGIQKWE